MPTTYGQIFENTFIRIVPLYLWLVYIPVIFIPSFMVLTIAYFLGVNESILANISSVFLPVALILFMALKAVFEIPAHLVSHSARRVTPS